MAENRFEAVLRKELQAEKHLPESLTVLRDFCSGIEASTGGKALCSLERGYLVSDGQEWRPTLRSSHGGPPQLLFRAYVPLTNAWPVTLDLHEDKLVRCADREELSGVLEEFLRDPNVIQQIRFVMEYATVPAAAS